MPDENRVAGLALPWAAAMPDDDLHHFLNDLVSAAMHRWQSDPDVPDREVLALVERACAQWRTPGEGFRSDAEDADTRLAEIRDREQAAARGPWEVESDRQTLTRRVTSPDFMLDANLGYVGNRNQADANFIAHARTDIPWLLAELTEALAKLAIAETRVEELAAENEAYKRCFGLSETA